MFIPKFSLNQGFFVSKMQSQMHLYHLDDAPDLRSCNLMIRSLPGTIAPGLTLSITEPERLDNFYGKGRTPRVRYVLEKKRLDYGRAHDDEYAFEYLEGKDA